MFKSILFACVLLAVSSSFADTLPQKVIGHNVLHGGNPEYAASSRDTVFLIGPWGSGAQVNGQFQDPDGSPAWNGFTHYDLTQITESHWHISDYNAAELNSTPNNLAMYCGDETIPACEYPDVVGGYGNSWNEILQFNYTVPEAAEPCTVTISGVFSHNTEPGYDYTFFGFETSSGKITVAQIDGIGVAIPFSHSLLFEPQDYFGSNHDQIRFEINMISDSGWSDVDCNYFGNGACQFDDLRIQCSNGNFDHTSDFQDGPGDWEIVFPPGVGDFTDLWQGLGDIDPCHVNTSVQVAFIDDGTRVPGAGPSYCINWCYGPGGYIVNTTGGAANANIPHPHLLNVLESPVLNWPGNSYNGADLQFDIYRHEDLSDDAPGIFYNWAVRSAVDPADLGSASWRNRTFVYYGGPDYVRGGDVVSDLIVPGVQYAQVQVECLEVGWIWGWVGDDGYPAPYFDNFRFVAFTYEGPSLATREIDLAQDNFSENLDEIVMTGDLSIYNVRFDAAFSKAYAGEGHNIPGDSITCNVASVRTGGMLVENRISYALQRNPLFDSARDGYPDVGTFDGIFQSGDKFYYDLPDSGFLFPGDVVHYFFEAADEVNHADRQWATVPADTAGFFNFSDPTAYDTAFQVHALPSILDAAGSYPAILFWNDFGNRGGENEWYGALNNLGLRMGIDYDAYFTNGPSSGIGNGLGGRAVYEQVKKYTDLLYTCGDLGVNTISNGDFNNDPGRDIHLMGDWFAQGEGRDAFFCGDELATDLNQAGALTSAFLIDQMNLVLRSNKIQPLINNQTTPMVLPTAGNSVFYTTPGWIAYGGCFAINTFDAVEAGDGAERLARFTNPSGAEDYIYSAATLNAVNDDRIITMPYDFMYIYTDINNPGPNGLATRVNVLREILFFFEINDGYWPTSVPGADKFFAKNYPNPFNPSTRLEFHLPRAEHLTVKVFNVRGELVKTLVDEDREAGTDHIIWDGTNEGGHRVSSGMYFYETRTGADVLVGKMVMVK